MFTAINDISCRTFASIQTFKSLRDWFQYKKQKEQNIKNAKNA